MLIVRLIFLSYFQSKKNGLDFERHDNMFASRQPQIIYQAIVDILKLPLTDYAT